jgi:hypothetical protein
VTLLNNGIPADRPYGFMRRDDHLMGLDPNKPLLEVNSADGTEYIPENWDTALTFAVKNRLPYCARWLIEGRGASVSNVNGEGISPLEVAMRTFPKRPKPPSDTLVFQKRWIKDMYLWTQLVRKLVYRGRSEIEYEQWSQLYPDAFACFEGMVLDGI